jgi:predicted ATPase/DNA-binding SARP family transcriptional activator
LFGRPDVAFGGGTHVLAPERHHRLLAYLALIGNWVERSDAAALLWPTHRRELAYANLRKALHFARSLPWAQSLEAQASSVRFRVDCDVHGFEASAREGRLGDALRLRRGALLDGFDEDGNPAWSEWLAGERARLTSRWQELARLRLAQLEAVPHESSALAMELLAIDALDEDAVIALMRAQRVAGRSGELRDTYEHYAATLRRDIGVEPSSRVKACLEASGRAIADRAIESFVGRTGEIEELSALLGRSECRLLTVTGPGGVGKSRLVKEAIRREAPLFARALWLPLDDLRSASQALARLAAELDVTPSAQQDAVRLLGANTKLRRMVLVFDNAENVEGIAQLAARLLVAIPGLKICATSRVRLGVAGEWLLPLSGLGLPSVRGPNDEQLKAEAARLFVAAAWIVRPGFDAEAQAADIVQLVRAVDGLPLAILLAANWVHLLPVAQIVAELERSLDVLEAGEGEERPEHRSVRATFEQSWQLLTASEQRALASLSVFAGSFSLAAAREVAGAPWPLFAGLADKSLLQMLDGGRCSLHPLIRQFAGEGFDAEARAAAIGRHASWFQRFLADVEREYQVRGPKALDAVDADLENCRAAWRWAVAHAANDALTVVSTTLLRYFEIRGRAGEGLDLLSEALPAVTAERTTTACAASVVSAVAHLQYRVYRNDEAISTARRALKLARAAGNRAARLRSLNVLGLCSWQAGRPGEGKRFLQQSLRLARDIGDARSAVIALGNLGVVERAMGNYEQAREVMVEALARTRELGDWVGVAIRLNGLAHLHQSRGEWDLARDCIRQGLEVSEAHAIAFTRPHLLVNLAHVEFFTSQFDEAERVARQALAEARDEGNGNVETTALLLLVRLAARRRAFADARAFVGEAIDGARRTGAVGLELDAVFCFAEVLAGEGAKRDAAALMRYYIERSEIEPGDRAVAQAELDRLGGDAAGTVAPTLDIDTLLTQIVERARDARRSR